MKRIFAVVMAMILVIIPFATTVSAENFVPSITVKPAPDVVGIGEDENGVIIGYIVNEDGETLAIVYEDCIVITSVEEAPESDEIPPEAAEILLEVFKDLSSDDTKLSSLSEAFNKLVADELGEDKDADDLVIRDLFDVTALCDDLKEYLPEDGTSIDLKFDISIGADEDVFAMTYIDDKWAPVENIKNNGDGTVTVTFEEFCPVAFFVPGEGEEDTPQTGDDANNTVWVLVMIGASVLVVLLAVANNRNRKKSEL